MVETTSAKMQGGIGLTKKLLPIQPRSWPLSLMTRLEFESSGARPIGADPQVNFSESWDFDIGVRYVWSRRGSVQPFVGGGLALVIGNNYIRRGPWFSPANWSFTTVGPSVDAGCFFPIRGNWHAGVLVSYSKGQGNMNGQGIEMGGIQTAVLIGKTWGAKRGL
jgi:hypothetical protein